MLRPPTSCRTFIRFDFLDQVQPRLGVNFNLREGKGDKIYANYGRYYNMDQAVARALKLFEEIVHE